MNHDQGKTLYLQGRTCRDSKRREDALPGICFCISFPSSEQGLLSCCRASCPTSWMITIQLRLKKTPISCFGSASASLLCSICRLKVAPVLSMAKALGEDSPGGGTSMENVLSKWLQSWSGEHWEEEQQSLFIFLTSFLWVCKKISTHSPRSCACSSIFPPGSVSPKQQASS